MSLFPSFRNAVNCSEPDFRNITKKQNFHYFSSPHSWETAELSNKNFIPMDTKLSERYNLKFLY